MPVGQQFMQPLAPAMQVMLQMLAFRRVVSARAKAVHQGNGYQEQESKPEVIRG